MFSNNYMFDTETNAWWKIGGQAAEGGTNFFWYCLTQNGNQLLAAPLVITSGTQPWFVVFDNTIPSPGYSWTSVPIPLSKDGDRVIDIRQVVVRVSDPTNTGNATIAVTIAGHTYTSTDTITNVPTRIRFNVGVQQISNLQVQLVGNNTGTNPSAPIVHSLDIGYQIRAKIAVDD
jgi:hypothetical protein